MLKVLIVVLVAVGITAYAHPVACIKEETVLSSCYEYAPFNKNGFQRRQSGPDTLVYYDLLYKLRQRVLIAFISPCGHVVYDSVERVATLGSERFEVNEKEGDEFSLAPQIRHHLTVHEFQSCP